MPEIAIDGISGFDPDRLVRALEMGRQSWPQTHATLLFYAQFSACFYRRMKPLEQHRPEEA